MARPLPRPKYHRCTVLNCDIIYDGRVSFFRFPKGNRERCIDWIKLCGRPELMNENCDFFHKLRVCAKHFDQNMFANYLKNRLLPVAKPIHFLPENIDPNVERISPDIEPFSQFLIKKEVDLDDVSNISKDLPDISGTQDIRESISKLAGPDNIKKYFVNCETLQEIGNPVKEHVTIKKELETPTEIAEVEVVCRPNSPVEIFTSPEDPLKIEHTLWDATQSTSSNDFQQGDFLFQHLISHDTGSWSKSNVIPGKIIFKPQRTVQNFLHNTKTTQNKLTSTELKKKYEQSQLVIKEITAQLLAARQTIHNLKSQVSSLQKILSKTQNKTDSC